mmetsp:Transcript_84933/g.221150  ORF Transcript_84933/g.221150 Transcript_84933/m.221150 type:complete len:218 (-) Transcript_84933:57-710(-)
MKRLIHRKGVQNAIARFLAMPYGARARSSTRHVFHALVVAVQSMATSGPQKTAEDAFAAIANHAAARVTNLSKVVRRSVLRAWCCMQIVFDVANVVLRSTATTTKCRKQTRSARARKSIIAHVVMRLSSRSGRVSMIRAQRHIRNESSEQIQSSSIWSGGPSSCPLPVKPCATSAYQMLVSGPTTVSSVSALTNPQDKYVLLQCRHRIQKQQFHYHI